MGEHEACYTVICFLSCHRPEVNISLFINHIYELPLTFTKCFSCPTITISEACTDVDIVARILNVLALYVGVSGQGFADSSNPINVLVRR